MILIRKYDAMKKNIIIILLICFFLTGCKESYSKVEYFCEEGTLENEKCRMYASTDVLFKCNDGEELEEGKCKYVSMKIPASTGKNLCAKGYYLYVNKCISEETKAQIIKETTCPVSTDPNVTYEKGVGVCFKNTCKKKSKDGKTCEEKVQESVPAEDIKYTCPSGYKYIYYGCRKYYYINVKSVCPAGEPVENSCVFYEYHDPKEYCEEGYILNQEENICEKNYYVDASTK